MLKINNLHAAIDGKGNPQGPEPRGRGRRGSARDHGSQRLGQEHARPGAGRTRDLHRHRRQRRLGGADLLALPAEERARAGVFLAFQYPVEIPGVSNNAYFLKAAQSSATPPPRLPEYDAMDFLKRRPR